MLKPDTDSADAPSTGPLGQERPEEGHIMGQHHPDALSLRAWLEDRHYAEPTIQVYASYIDRVTTHLEQIPLESATLEHLELFWATLPPTAPSRNQCRKALMAYYKSVGHRGGEPADELPAFPEPSRLPRPVEDSEFRLLIDACIALGGIHRAVGLILSYTGCRIGELQRAQWGQFELRGEHPVWYIEGKGSRRRGHKIRQVPLHARLVTELTVWRMECSSAVFVFPTTKQSASGTLSQTKLREIVYQIAEEAGLPRVVPHRFRHTVATTVLAATKDLTGVQDLLGHQSAATTQLYTRVAAERLRDLVDALPVPSQPLDAA